MALSILVAVRKPDLPKCYVAGPVPWIVVHKRERYGYARLGVARAPSVVDAQAVPNRQCRAELCILSRRGNVEHPGIRCIPVDISRKVLIDHAVVSGKALCRQL